MDRVYNVLLSLGYPREGIDWLRRHRLLTITVLAALAWLPVIALVWFVLRLIG
jgi:hypothetical protein